MFNFLVQDCVRMCCFRGMGVGDYQFSCSEAIDVAPLHIPLYSSKGNFMSARVPKGKLFGGDK